MLGVIPILGGIPRSVVSAYDTSKLSDKGVAILYYLLKGVVVAINGDKVEFLTLDKNQLCNNFIVPPETNLPERNVESINKYLADGRFYCYKIKPLETMSCFIGQGSNMNPYPKLEEYSGVYRLDDLVKAYNKLKVASVSNELEFKLCNRTNSSIYLNNIGCKSVVGTVFSGRFWGTDRNGNFEGVKLTDIMEISIVSDNPNISKLLNGICKYKNSYVTLNYGVLEKFYGESRLYTKLESLNVRKRLCYHELLSRAGYTPTFLAQKYNLPIDYFGYDDRYELIKKLSTELSSEPQTKGIRARVLSNNLEHRSFYITIPKDAELEVVEDLTSITPTDWYYYGASDTFGLRYVKVSATKSTAKAYGKTEFERCFGVGDFVACTEKPLEYKGFTTEVQRNICQEIMYGYTRNFMGYAKPIVQLCEQNGVSITKVDIQYLFINNLAQKYVNSGEVKLSTVSVYLLNFINVCKDKTKHDKLLSDTLWGFCKGRVQRIAKDLEDNGFNDYEVSEDGSITKSIQGGGTVVFHLTKQNKISQYADITYKGVDLGRKNITDK